MDTIDHDSTQGTTAISVRNVTVRRGQNDVLTDLTFELKENEILALIGPNGAGKSTLLRAMLGLLPYGGNISVRQQDVKQLSHEKRASLMAYVPQQTSLDAPLIVRDVVGQGRYAKGQRWFGRSQDDENAIDDAMGTVDVARIATRRFSELSFGERKLVLLARALATGAKVLLLDEPSAGLDMAHVLSFFERIRQLRDRGYAICIVLHELSEVHRVSDRVLVLHQGRLCLDGGVAEVMNSALISDVYGIEIVPGGGYGYKLIQKGST